MLMLTIFILVYLKHFFALVITGIGCHQGLAVRKDSQSIGKATTTSVVYSIFLNNCC